jgi:tetratricopeptide (TPR) repeat protein
VPASGRAYEWYLRANQLGRDARNFHAARELFQRAVDDDPGYAPAWAALGRMHRVIGKYGGEDQAGSSALAEAALKRALELNPDLGLAHGLYTYLEADAGLAMYAMVRLLGQPGTATDPELLAGLVHACRYCGLLDESVAAHDRARRLDPIVRTSVAQTHWVRRDFQRALDADIDNPSHVTVLSVEGMGRVSEAIALVSAVLNSQALPQTPRVFLSAFRAVFEGDRQAALAAVEHCMRLPFHDPEGIYRMAWMLARLRQDDAALATLRRAVRGLLVSVPPDGGPVVRAATWQQ